MRAPWVAGAVLVALVAASLPLPAADHRDGPIFGPPGVTITRSIRDINDVYVFQSPSDAANTVFIMTVSPFSTATTPAVFDPSLTYEVRIATTDLINTSDDFTGRVNFGFPDGSGAQDVTFTDAGGDVLAQGRTGQNLPIDGGGLFRAGEQDDPFFFDAAGFTALLNGVPPVPPSIRPPGTATNFFGPNGNLLAITVEVPSSVFGPPGTLIGVWARTVFNGVQMDRMGRPGINTALIPPVPRGSNFPIGGTPDQNRQERRNAFNAGHPRDDRANFKSDMVSVLQSFYGQSLPDANGISDLLLPDILVFETGNPNGFGTPVAGFLGNGRRLRDDVIDVELNVLTDGGITTDSVADDNGTRITDGNSGTVAAFPYIGARNASPTAVPGAQPRVTVGDYDGDGRADLAVFRPSTAESFVFGSTDGFPGAVPFGAPGDVPVPGDYDADGRTDLAVFRPSTAEWFVFGSLTGFPGAVALGAPGDLPVPGDYDGDRRADLAVFRPSTAEWFVFGSATGFPGAVPLGAPGDIPVPGDYDGDRRADLAVFRPSTAEWFIFGSATGFPGAIPLGGPGDRPVPGDYDADDRADLAVFRPTTAEWFIFGSATGFPGAIPFGGPGDIPVIRPPALSTLLP
jgi:hypothetical protein